MLGWRVICPSEPAYYIVDYRICTQVNSSSWQIIAHLELKFLRQQNEALSWYFRQSLSWQCALRKISAIVPSVRDCLPFVVLVFGSFSVNLIGWFALLNGIKYAWNTRIEWVNTIIELADLPVDLPADLPYDIYAPCLADLPADLPDGLQHSGCLDSKKILSTIDAPLGVHSGWV